MKHSLFSAGLGLLTLFALADRGVAASVPTVEIMAGSVTQPDGKLVVALRWTIKSGWLPEGGFNIYRMEDGKPSAAPLNPAPLGALHKHGDAPARGGDAARLLWEGSKNTPLRGLSYPDALLKASNPPAGWNDEDHFHQRVRPTSSEGIFQGFGTRAQTLHTSEGPPLPQKREQMPLPENLTSYLKKLGRVDNLLPNQPAPKVAAKVALSPVEECRQIRSHLLAGSMVHQDMARDLGLAFDDNTAVAGKKYAYAVRSIDATGHESPTALANVTITAGADSPLAPAGLTAWQMDADTVAFRWTRPTSDDEKKIGLPSYQLLRIDKANPNGVPVNTGHIVIADIPNTDPETKAKEPFVEPHAFAHDNAAPLGAVSYKLSQVDIFGRTTETALYPFTMKDWHTPHDPVAVAGKLTGDKVTIVWKLPPNSPAGVSYRIYRRDIEVADARLELITSKPVKGENVVKPVVVQGQRSLGHLVKDPASWLQSTDPTPSKDHSYRYTVTACFDRNGLDSTGVTTAGISVPQTTPPLSPDKLDVAVKLVPKRQPSMPGLSNDGPPKAKQLAANKALTTANGFTSQKSHPGNQGSAAPVDIGATVTLTWNPSQGAVSYRVYRANATGYLIPGAGLGKSLTNISEAFKNHKSLALGPGGFPVEAASKPKNLPATGSSLYEPKFVGTYNPHFNDYGVLPYTLNADADVNKVPAANFALLGEVKGQTNFADNVPRSHAHQYLYSVVAVNRWGFPNGGPPEGVSVKRQSVNVPGTMPPSAPVILSVLPDEAGAIHVQFQMNAAEEQVDHYRLLRKVLYKLVPVMAANSSPAPSPGTGNHARKTLADFGIFRHQSPLQAWNYAKAQQKAAPADTGDTEILPAILQPKGAAVAASGGLRVFQDNTADTSTVYSYRVVAVNTDKLESAPSAAIAGYTDIQEKSKPPKNLAFTPTAEAVQLTWAAAGGDVKGYIVQRASAATPAEWVQLTGIRTETTYLDYSAVPGQAYVYEVLSVNSEGAISDPVTVQAAQK